MGEVDASRSELTCPAPHLERGAGARPGIPLCVLFPEAARRPAAGGEPGDAEQGGAVQREGPRLMCQSFS